MEEGRYMLSTGLLLAICVGVALVANQAENAFGFVLSLTGAVACSTYSFILPAAIYMKLGVDEEREDRPASDVWLYGCRWWRDTPGRRYGAAAMLALYGCSVFVVGTVGCVLGLVK